MFFPVDHHHILDHNGGYDGGFHFSIGIFIVYATAESNIKSDYPDKVITSGLSTFQNVNFAHWSFGTNRKPQLIRAKLKVKKATYYKLIFYSKSASATATILSTDIQVRYTGNVK